MIDKPLNFLVVEDNLGDFTLLKTYIGQTRIKLKEIYHVERLTDISAMPLSAIDLAFLDLSLPDSNGIESFKYFNRALPKIPIIVLSGMADENVAIECIVLGAQDYLRKDDLNETILEKSIQYSIERKNNLEELRGMQEKALDHMKQITEATILGQEKEKDEIGKELHDNINQILASAKLYLDIALDNGNAIDSIRKSKEHISKAIEEIRLLSKSLVPPEFTNNGLVDKINEIIILLNSAGIIAHRNLTDFDEYNLDNGRKLTLFRVVQEQFNNILKYAEADEVWITLKKSQSQVSLIIEDNGVGFDTNKISKGIGLRNIESRISFYAGTVDIESLPGKGTSLKVLLPIHN